MKVGAIVVYALGALLLFQGLYVGFGPGHVTSARNERDISRSKDTGTNVLITCVGIALFGLGEWMRRTDDD
jgi:hypothetical protein